MLNATSYVYSDSYILAEGKMTVVGQGADGSNKEVFLKHCAPFIKCINKLNNVRVVEDLDIVIPINSSLECSENCAKKSASLWQCCEDEPDNNKTGSKSFKFKSSVTGNSNNAGILNVKIVVTLNYLSNFWKTLEIQLINCEITIYLNWSENCIICEKDRAALFQ